MENEILRRAAAYFARRRCRTKMTYTFIARACDDLPVAACCRVMEVSTSGFYAWRAEPVCQRTSTTPISATPSSTSGPMSRRSYGSPRVHAELRLGRHRALLARASRAADAPGRDRRHPPTPPRGCTGRDLDAQPSDDLVKRAFDPIEPDRLWLWTSPSTRLVTARPIWPSSSTPSAAASVGWSIADHMRSEASSTPSRWPSGDVGHPLVRRSPIPITGSTYTSWAFGGRLHGAGLLGSMGSIGDCFDNSVAEASSAPSSSSCSTASLGERQQLAQAIFEWIEAWYNPRRRHSYCQMLSPVDYEAAPHAA